MDHIEKSWVEKEYIGKIIRKQWMGKDQILMDCIVENWIGFEELY